MRRSIKVFLGEEARLVGTIRYNAEGARESAAFEYDATWLSAPDRFSLDPALQLVAGPQFHARTKDGSIFHAAIADTEPDGWGRRVILRDHAKRRQEARRAGGEPDAGPLRHLDFLLAVDDASRVGALRFQDEEGVFRRDPEPGRRTAPPLIELAHLAAASRSVETNTETVADLAYLRGRGTSLGGLRPKCTVVDEAGRLCIGKFTSVADERAVTKGAHACRGLPTTLETAPIPAPRRPSRRPRGASPTALTVDLPVVAAPRRLTARAPFTHPLRPLRRR